MIVLAIVALLAGGGYLAYNAGLLDGLLGRSEPVAPAAIPPPPGLELPRVLPPDPVLKPASGNDTLPSRKEVRSHLADSVHEPSYGRHLGVLVQAVGSERDLLRVGGNDLFTPASTMKLLTSTTVLELLGPSHRFSTTVTRGDSRRQIVLVGGGDPLLTQRPLPVTVESYPEQATLRALARKTADSLQADKVDSVRLGYDASLFSGPADNPHWESDYVSGEVVSPISALWVDEGRVGPGLSARSANPAEAAAEAFAEALDRQGIEVRGDPASARAPTRAEELAQVRSAPLSQIVQHVLEISDNEGAEVLLRHAAVASGRPGTSEAGADAIRETLSRLGIDMSRASIYDGSGLSRDNKLTLDVLAGTLQLASAPAEQDLRRVVSGLPVAGFNGSLAYRFGVYGESGRGDVRAKTGTLSRVHALAGVAVDREGTPMVFVAVADKVPLVDTLDARAALDRLTADVASCCR